ncbi:hypothetical protein C8T65DRAFT_735744 [Cerioporus squamosus]|nr:hypothetical protein C8T65DRAFT_735744 [Cerioporus squamosus]
MADEKIVFPCFVVVNKRLRKDYTLAIVPIDDDVDSIATAVSRILGPAFPPPSIDLWKPHNNIPKKDGYRHLLSLCEQHDYDLSKFCDDLAEQRGDCISDVFDSLSQNATVPRLVASIALPTQLGGVQGATADEPEHQDEAKDILTKLMTEFRKVRQSGLSGSPSHNCKPPNYRKYQLGPTPILDGRYADTPNTIAPPVENFHYAFASFVAEYRDERTQPPEEFVRKVGKLMGAVSTIATNEICRESDTRGLLCGLLYATFGELLNSNRRSVDHILSYRREGPSLGLAALAIIEDSELELGTSDDGSVQGSFSYIQHWTNPSQKVFLDACFCPSFVVAIAGSYIIISGAILTGHVIVHRLTDYIWLANSRMNDDANALRIARVFFALGNALTRLRSFYAELPTPADNRARFFPLANRYMDGDRVVEFKYTAYLKDTEEACGIFRATECDGAKRELVVKFVERYGKAAHNLLASHGLAPRLLYYGDIWLSGPEHRGCGSRKMVVMEYVEGLTAYAALYSKKKDSLPEGVHGVVERAVKLLHDAGMVHGDIRLGNILIADAGDKDDVGTRVKILDFDWAGEAGTARYPLHLSEVVNWPVGVADYALITKAHDVEMARRLGEAL